MLRQSPQPGAGLRPSDRLPTGRVSIVCVTRNRVALLQRCLESCLDQDYGEIELVVVDNASTDGTSQVLRTRFPQALLIHTHRNLGFFPALNLAIANATGDYVMCVDDDAWFTQRDAISRLVGAFRCNPSPGAVTCNIEGPHEAAPTEMSRCVHGFKTGFTILPRAVFTDWVGYYPDTFFRSAGEQYVATALWDSGRPVVQLAEVRMYHEQALAGRSAWDWSFYGLRSQILVLIMRDPALILPVRLLSKLARSFLHAIRSGSVRAWAAAWCDVWYHVPSALRLRRPISWRTQRLLWKLRRDVYHWPEAQDGADREPKGGPMVRATEGTEAL